MNQNPRTVHLAEPSDPLQLSKIFEQSFVVGTPSLQVITPGEPPSPLLGTQPFELLGIGGEPLIFLSIQAERTNNPHSRCKGTCAILSGNELSAFVLCLSDTITQ